MGFRVRLIHLAAAILVASVAISACRMNDGGQNGPSASPSAASQASDGQVESPMASEDTDYGY